MPFIVDLPINSMVIFHSYVSLPEVNLVFFNPSISFGQPQRQRHIQMVCCAVVVSYALWNVVFFCTAVQLRRLGEQQYLNLRVKHWWMVQMHDSRPVFAWKSWWSNRFFWKRESMDDALDSYNKNQRGIQFNGNEIRSESLVAWLQRPQWHLSRKTSLCSL